jgi:hypothetical protein
MGSAEALPAGRSATAARLHLCSALHRPSSALDTLLQQHKQQQKSVQVSTGCSCLLDDFLLSVDCVLAALVVAQCSAWQQQCQSACNQVLLAPRTVGEDGRSFLLLKAVPQGHQLVTANLTSLQAVWIV